MQSETRTKDPNPAEPRGNRYLSAVEERDLLEQWRKKNDGRAANALVSAFAPLVAKHALAFRHYGLPLDDLIQEGNLGLMLAAGGFDPERGFRFGTYATWWVRAQIQDYVLRNTSIVRLGATRERKSLFFKLRHIQADLSKEGDGTRGNVERIADMFKIPRADVEQIDGVLRQGDYALNATHPSTEQEVQGLLPDVRPNPEAVVMERSGRVAQRQCIDRALSVLTDRERLIILSRRLSDEPVKLETLGRKLGVSPERVRQIEKAALSKMRDVLMITAEKVSDLFGESRGTSGTAASPNLSFQQGH